MHILLLNLKGALKTCNVIIVHCKNFVNPTVLVFIFLVHILLLRMGKLSDNIIRILLSHDSISFSFRPYDLQITTYILNILPSNISTHLCNFYTINSLLTLIFVFLDVSVILLFSLHFTTNCRLNLYHVYL